MAMELDTILGEIRHRQVRVVVVTGAGETFCSGADLTEAIAAAGAAGGLIPGYSRAEDGEFARWAINDQFPCHYAQRALSQAGRSSRSRSSRRLTAPPSVPGFEMTLACDLRIMTDRARLSEIAVPAGVVSEWSCPRNLPKLVGLTLANELILTGRSRRSAAEAKAISAWSTGSWRPKA